MIFSTLLVSRCVSIVDTFSRALYSALESAIGLRNGPCIFPPTEILNGYAIRDIDMRMHYGIHTCIYGARRVQFPNSNPKS